MPLKTPGVYIVEKNAFPNSVVQVATTVPAFIGHTNRALNGDVSLSNTSFQISSLAEYHQYFGGPPTPMFSIAEHKERTGAAPPGADGKDLKPELPEALFDVPGKSGTQTYALTQSNPAYMLYGAMRLFFQNGGGACYVTSVGTYSDGFDAERFLAAIAQLVQEPEPTMLVVPETTRLARKDAVKVQKAILKHCGDDTRSRFAILDISGGYLPQHSQRGDPVATFRDDIGTRYLDFAAAYYPWLNTQIFSSRDFTFKNIEPASRDLLISLLKWDMDTATGSQIARIDTPELRGDFTIRVPPGQKIALTEQDLSAEDATSSADELRYEVLDSPKMAGQLVTSGTNEELRTFTQADLAAGKISFRHDETAGPSGQFDILVTDKNGCATTARTVFVLADADIATLPDIPREIAADDAAAQQNAETIDKTLRAAVPLYTQIMNAITTHENTLPPAAAMAGIYTAIDNSRGVWKAPANVSVNAVTSPTVNITHDQQENLNVSTTGKSINAIRSFVGKGTLVWGARTLDGNSLDWRYVNVRRTMIMIEQSIRLACKAYVFEPNTENTWVTIRSMLENFLTGIWKAGGLAGAAPTEAFSVHVGLGSTMTSNDILNGVLNVAVMVAITRPAEFIVLEVSQQMQQS